MGGGEECRIRRRSSMTTAGNGQFGAFDRSFLVVDGAIDCPRVLIVMGLCCGVL